jgi:LysR family nod box-dependent transcriptional activator
MRFKGLDLNLLMAFDALLDCRSVSAAARRMNLSQPAMSAALSRLRDYFGDDILVADGKRMHPTAYAEALLPQLRECLRSVDALVSSSTKFDPSESRRVFSLIASDYIIAALLAPLVADLAVEAPGVRFDLLSPGDDSPHLIDEGKADLIIAPEGFIRPDHPAELLFEERHVVVGWSGNPLLHGAPSEAEILAAGHVAVALGAQRTASYADRQLAVMGKSRRVEVTAGSFTAVPWLLMNTPRIALMHERLALAMRSFFPIRIAPIPFDFPVMREMVQHHRARANDEGLSWFRQQLARRAQMDNPSRL